MWRVVLLVVVLGVLGVGERASACGPSDISANRTGCIPVLSWTPRSGVPGYAVFRGTTSNLADAVVVGYVVPATAASYTDASADPGTGYYYWVGLLQAGAPPQPQSCTPNGPVAAAALPMPSAPASVTLTQMDCSGMRFSWPAAANATSYRVVLDGGNGPSIADEIVNGTTFDATGWIGYAPSRIQVYGLNSCLQSGAVQRTFSPPTETSAYSGFQASTDEHCQVTISWTRIPGGFDSGLMIKWTLLNSFPATATVSVPAGATSFVHTGIADGRSFRYEIWRNGLCPNARVTLQGAAAPVADGYEVGPRKVRVGEAVTLAMQVEAGTPAPATSWWKIGPDAVQLAPIAESAHFIGTTTATLVIPAVRAEDNGVYVLQAAYACKTQQFVARLVVDAPCRADYNSDGALRLDDVFAFLNGWFAGCP